MNSRLPSSISTSPLPAKWIEKLFDKMLLDYGKKFTDQWSGADPDKLISHWANELSGYTGPELKKGYEALASREWPPTLPEFKKLCRAPVDSVHAYYQAVAGISARSRGEMGEWSHPAIYWASVRMAFDLSSQTFSQVKGRWEQALADQMEKGEWEPIPEPMLALAAPGKGELSRKKAGAMLKELGASGILSSTGRDERRWAKKIIQREADGDKTVTALQIRFAREAMAA